MTFPTHAVRLPSRLAVRSTAPALGLCLLAAALAAATTTSGDYAVHGQVDGDNAGPALDALVHGRLGAFAAHQPVMGLTSLLLRLVPAALAGATNAGETASYRLGAFACVLPAALLVAWLIADRRPAPGAALGTVLLAYFLLLAPTTRQAVSSGHPEEILAATLATCAVLAATRQRAGWAGILLGLAIGAKPWALLTAMPVLLVLRCRRRVAAGAAAAAGALLVAPPILADPSAFASAARALGQVHLVNALSAWWPLAGVGRLASGAGTPFAARLPFALDKSAAMALALAAGVSILLVVSLRVRRNGCRIDALALLSLLGLIRCLADPGPVEYYFVDLVIPLAVWEAAVLRRPPLLAGATVAALLVIFSLPGHVSPATVNAGALVPASALGAALAARSFGLGVRRILNPLLPRPIKS